MSSRGLLRPLLTRVQDFQVFSCFRLKTAGVSLPIRVLIPLLSDVIAILSNRLFFFLPLICFFLSYSFFQDRQVPFVFVQDSLSFLRHQTFLRQCNFSPLIQFQD